jgi:hypothetical protein
MDFTDMLAFHLQIGGSKLSWNRSSGLSAQTPFQPGLNKLRPSRSGRTTLYIMTFLQFAHISNLLHACFAHGI